VALQNPLDAGTYRDVIGRMLEVVDRLTRLVESLLILTRADSRKVLLTPEDLDLGELAGNVIDQLRVLADEKQQSACSVTMPRSPVSAASTCASSARPISFSGLASDFSTSPWASAAPSRR